MKQKQDSNTKQGHSTNMLLYAVAPQPKLSTDAIALEGAVVSRGNGIGATSETYLMDCIVGMKHYPDKYFDLAVVDPPYGIGAGSINFKNGTSKKDIGYKVKDWDISIPDMIYFIELFRVSKNQIVWGGNYFANLWPCRGYLIWDKGTGENSYADCELAWSSIDGVSKIFSKSWVGANAKDNDGRYHPTQKPVTLYDWVFKNYSEPGQKVIDTHLGSGSSRISAHKYKMDFTAFEIDKEYFDKQEQRYRDFISQTTLF